MVYTVYVRGNSTSQKIIAAAAQLLDKEGVDGVTMRRVAGIVGITPMAIYRHYPGRRALLSALADQGFEELTGHLERKRCAGNAAQQLARMMDVYLDHGLENPRLFELMFLKARKGARRYPADFRAGASPTANMVAQVVGRGIQSGHFKDDDVWEIVFALGALSHGLIMLHLGGRTGMTPAQFRAFYRRSFRRYINGICN